MHSTITRDLVQLLPGAVSPAFCASVRAAMDRGAADPAEILEDAIEHQDHVRRTLSIEVDPATVGRSRTRSRRRGRTGRAVRPWTWGRGRAPASCAICRAASTARTATGATCRRGRARRAGSWRWWCSSTPPGRRRPGGLHGRGAAPLSGASGAAPIDIVPRAGTLVAFPATMLHEVTRVERRDPRRGRGLVLLSRAGHGRLPVHERAHRRAARVARRRRMASRRSRRWATSKSRRPGTSRHRGRGADTDGVAPAAARRAAISVPRRK